MEATHTCVLFSSLLWGVPAGIYVTGQFEICSVPQHPVLLHLPSLRSGRVQSLRVCFICRVVAIEYSLLSITAGGHMEFAAQEPRPCAIGYQLHTVQIGLTPNVLTPLCGDESVTATTKKMDTICCANFLCNR